MSATVTLEISDYLPSNFNFEGFTFTFRTDNFEDTIDFSKRNTIYAGITNLKKDRKFTIRVSKNGSVVGISEIVLPQMFLIKREENLTKQVIISMVDTIKKSLLGKDWTKSLQLVIKARIDYKEENYTSYPGPRSSSARPVSAMNGESVKNGSGNKARQSTSGGRTSLKPMPGNYVRGSIFVMKDKNFKPEVVDEYGEPETSFIDNIFNDEFNQEFEGVEKVIQDFITGFSRLSKETLEETNAENLRERVKNIIPQLFELQKIYYENFNNSTRVNRRVRELLIKYNEKFRTIVKKSNRLREALESNQIRTELTAFINKQDNKKVMESIALNRSELDMFKKLFKIDYTRSDLNNFKKQSNINQVEVEKQNLMAAILSLSQNNSILAKLPEDKKIQLSYLTSKYSSNEVDKVSKKINLDDVEENLAEENYESSPKKSKLSIIKSNIVDNLDLKVDEQLIGIYERKKLSNIPFRRISNGEYEFGTQKLILKLEGDLIRVKTSSGYVLLEKFLEIHAPLEEAKINRNQSLSDKSKANPNPLKNSSERNSFDSSKNNNYGVISGLTSKNGSSNKKK